jgi:putative DNA primase/helicase
MNTISRDLSDLDDDQEPDVVSVEFTEDAVAQRFTGRYRDILRYTAQRKEWRRWNGACWQVDTTLAVFDLVRRFCREVARACNIERFSRRLSSAQFVAAVEKLVRADRVHAMRPEQWDADPWLLNTPKGIVDLRTGRLEPLRSSAYCSMITPVGPEGDCPRWLRFLERVTAGDAELQAFIRRWCGYCLTGMTTEQVLVFLHGTGANGKSVFSITLSGILGDYARVAPMDCFTENRFSGHPTELANLQGVRLVTAVETGEGHRWNESRIKSLTGGDKIAARFMRGDFFQFQPVFKLLFAGNHRPTLQTVDEAITRRFRLLPFTTMIPESERDPRLVEQLRSELPGILQWAICGCQEWQQRGLQAPEAVQRASADYLQSQDVLKQWIEECCDVSPVAWAPSSALFESWRRYSEAAGEPPPNQRSFAAKLSAHGFQLQRTKLARGFLGIRLQVKGDT